MNFLDLAKKRKSIRGYRSEPVDDALLNQVLEAGRLAPSAKNLQPYHFIVIRSEEGLKRMQEAYPAPFFKEAPVVIAAFSAVCYSFHRTRKPKHLMN